MEQESPIIIVGAGLSGLCAALHLHKAGQPVLVLEASDAVGGRIRTDTVDGFLLDRGFQVLLTAYPQVQALLDLPALDLKPFTPGSLSYFNGRLHPIRDLFRQPAHALGALLSPVGSLADKIRVGLLRMACVGAQNKLHYCVTNNANSVQHGAHSSTNSVQNSDNSLNNGVHNSRPFASISTQTYLERFGFSSDMMTRFFEPFLGGVFLDQSLSLPADYFRFLFGCFAIGEVCLPAHGMQAIPEQLADGLPEGTIRLNTAVTSVSATQVTLASGEQLSAKAVILATDAHTAGKLMGQASSEASPGYRSTRCLYFSAPQTPVDEPILVLNGEGPSAGPINTLCVPSQVALAYAPAGQHLISLSVVGDAADQPEEALIRDVLGQSRAWFGPQVDRWTLLKSYHVRHALPRLGWAEALQAQAGQLGVTLCGDYSPDLPFSPSIQGAMVSGQDTAERVLNSFLELA